MRLRAAGNARKIQGIRPALPLALDASLELVQHRRLPASTPPASPPSYLPPTRPDVTTGRVCCWLARPAVTAFLPTTSPAQAPLQRTLPRARLCRSSSSLTSPHSSPPQSRIPSTAPLHCLPHPFASHVPAGPRPPVTSMVSARRGTRVPAQRLVTRIVAGEGLGSRLARTRGVTGVTRGVTRGVTGVTRGVTGVTRGVTGPPAAAAPY